MMPAYKDTVPRRSNFIWLLPWIALAGCATQDESQALGNGDGETRDDAAAECVQDLDCVPAGPSCCHCPSYALPTSDGWGDSCADVGCGVPDTCPATSAVCAQGACVLQCQPIECDSVCDTGFSVDNFGCLTCECTPQVGAVEPECQVDSDCVRVASDCCGCESGGQEHAIPGSDLEAYTDQLACADEMTTCPDVDVCEEVVAVCQLELCVLAPADEPNNDGGMPPPKAPVQFCGTAELPPCPDGQACILNDPAAMDANEAGVGVCRSE